MSLPDAFLDELKSRLSLAQVIGRKVVWDTKKTNQAKGDFWAPCPFHNEKTASFHVDDRKGFYYCFGCHEKGNAFNFVQKTENVNFPEAVEILAREFGMTMPARDPRAAAKADRNKMLADVMEQAVQFYKLQYSTNAAKPARDYIDQRGLSAQTQTAFEIGFAPNGRDRLTKSLMAKGIDLDHLITVGLTGKPDDGRSPYDRFRNRIIFPIRDPRGRCIGFGGRAMDPNDRAKYLNSPETPLFDKGRSLYNHGPAREAAGKANQLIVAEGYMDVIALHQFGFHHAVAPLGTAITADQLALLWRIHPEPIIALDGDTAGLRAAMRLLDLALPLLQAGKALRFCLLPQGQDPDDLLRSGGKPAMSKLLDHSIPMVDLLWQRETEGQNFDSPERRAALDAKLRQSILSIADKSVRSHYGSAIATLRKAFFTPQTQQKAGIRSGYSYGAPQRAKPHAKTKASLLGQSDDAPQRLREAVILTASILNPNAALSQESNLEMLQLSDQRFAKIRSALLAHLHDEHEEESARLLHAMQTELGYDPLVELRQMRMIKNHPYLHDGSDPMMIARALNEEIEKHYSTIGHVTEIEDAAADLTGHADEGVTWRLKQAALAKTDAYHNTIPDDDINESDGALATQLQDMLDREIWKKPKKR